MSHNQSWMVQSPPHSGTTEDASSISPKRSNGEVKDMSEVIDTKSFCLSPNAAEFYPRNYHALCSQRMVEVVNEVRRAIATMSHNPADFFHLVDPLTKSLSARIKDAATLNAVVEEIFQQAVVETNFRYTGARTCAYLAEHLRLGEKVGVSSFQQLLVGRCQRELNFFLDPVNASPNSGPRFVGFSLFMGELLLNMKNSEGRQLIAELPHQVCQLIKMLVATSTDWGLRCTVQLLKLTGAHLDDHKMNLDDIFTALNVHISNSETNPTLRLMMMSAGALRARNWDRQEDERETMEGAGDTRACMLSAAMARKHSEDENALIYGGSGGQMYTTEEQELCDEFDGALGGPVSPPGCPNQQLDSSSSTPQYLIGENEMDAETASAFDQFIAESTPQPHQQQQPPSPPSPPRRSMYNNCWTYQP